MSLRNENSVILIRHLRQLCRFCQTRQLQRWICYTFIPCHEVHCKVQVRAWCHSFLWSKRPPVPRGTPASVQLTQLTSVFQINSTIKKQHFHQHVLVPAPDLQQRYRPGWGKSRTQATHILCSQTAWAQQDRSVAELGPKERTVQNVSFWLKLYRTQ